jgi:hypothetical protein
MVVAVAVVCWQSVSRIFGVSSFHASQVLPESFLAPEVIRKDFSAAAAQSAKPAKPVKAVPAFPNVYPYSIVPGGVKDASDLRDIALRDYVVRRHFAQFNFTRARLVRAEAREVYLSYRIRNSVFWTRKKVRLHRGELLLTDGKITARVRCGNQVSDTAQPEVSDQEPDQDVLDQPVIASGAFPARPLLSAPSLPAMDPAAPKLFASSFLFPYEPVGVPLPSGSCRANERKVNGHCYKTHKPPVVPEPSTMLLGASGLALMLWRYRRIARPIGA